MNLEEHCRIGGCQLAVGEVVQGDNLDRFVALFKHVLEHRRFAHLARTGNEDDRELVGYAADEWLHGAIDIAHESSCLG